MHSEMQSWLKLHPGERGASTGVSDSDSTHLNNEGVSDPACPTEEQDSHGDSIIAVKSPSSGISNLVEVCLQGYCYIIEGGVYF